MDTKRLFFGMTLALVVMVIWQFVVYRMGEKYGWNKPPEPTTQQVASTQPFGSTTQPTTNAVAGSSTQPGMTAATGAFWVKGNDLGPTASEIGSTAPNDATYAMGIALQSRGAGIDAVTLNQFKQVADHPALYEFQKPYSDSADISHALATKSIVVNGVTIDLTNANWTPEEIKPNAVTYGLVLAGANGPAVKLHKTYFLPDRQTTASTSQGFEIAVRLGFENLTKDVVTVKSVFNGPTMPPKEIDRGPDRQVLGGYNAEDEIAIDHYAIEEFTKDKPTRDMIKSQKGLPLMWAGASSTYFDAIVRPEKPAKDAAVPVTIGNLTAKCLNPEAAADVSHELVMEFETSELKIPAGQTATLPLHVFFGPKKRELLNNDYFSTFPLMYNATLVLTSGLCGICTFQPLINALVRLLGIFHWVFGGFAGHGDWGLAIIALVVLVRTCLHPITKMSQVSMMSMSKYAPEMERLKKKYGDDKEGLNKAMMEFYREHGFGMGPVLGCLPMFLQMPIWIALYSSLQSTFELRQAPFLWGFTWIHDLAQQDHLINFGRSVPLIFGMHISGINLLPLLMCVAVVLQQKYMQPPTTSTLTPEQEQQQKMMRWMSPVLFLIMLYNGPSGLNLYIMTSTTIGIIESKIIRRHIKEKEEAEKEGRVLVDAPKKLRSSGGDGNMKKPDAPRKGLMGWLAELQAKAEQVRRDNDRGKGK